MCTFYPGCYPPPYCAPQCFPPPCDFWYKECLPTFMEIFLEANQCPAEHKIYTMYHGTSYKAAKEIIKHGFKQSTDGMLGRGVYVSRDIHKAKQYPHGHEPRKVVLKLRVNVGRVKKIDHKSHPLRKTWHYHGFSTAWVPPHTMNPSGLEEDCVYNPERIKVIDIAHGKSEDVKKLKRLLHHH